VGERGDLELALTAGQALACGSVFALAIRHGVGGVTPLELALLGLAALGVAGWQIAGDPTWRRARSWPPT